MHAFDRLLLAPLFGHAAPGNLGMTSSLLHLPSRATPSPPPSSSSSPVQASPTTRPASSSFGIMPIPGTAPKKKQSSLTAFLSPAAKQQQIAGAQAASQSTAGRGGVIEFPGGHSQEFIEQSWQQRLHGRQPSEPPVVTQPQISHKQQQQKKKTAEQPGAVTKERGVKRPLEFPEDIDALLPPEWGGKAVKPDKPKGKGKQKGKVSLTAQYLHPDTVQHPSNSAMHNRPPQLSRSGAAAPAVQPQPPPHTRPSAAAAVASASRQIEAQQAQQAQQAQHAQQGQSSSVPWFSSNSSAAKQQQPQTPIKNTHSFGDWLSPPWGQRHPQPNTLSLPSSSSHSSRLYGADASALPLPVQPHSQSEQRLGQLTAMHHKPALPFQSGDQQTTTNESTKSNLRPPPSRSPSPVLMEDEEFDAQLNSKTKSVVCLDVVCRSPCPVVILLTQHADVTHAQLACNEVCATYYLYYMTSGWNSNDFCSDALLLSF